MPLFEIERPGAGTRAMVSLRRRVVVSEAVVVARAWHPRTARGTDRAHRQKSALRIELRARGRSARARSTVALMSSAFGGDWS
jgi:hypothetical protein